MVHLEMMFPVEFKGHLAISKDSIPFFVSLFDLEKQFFVKLLIVAFFSVEPFIVGRTLDTAGFTKFTQGVGLGLMQSTDGQVECFISDLA